MLSGYHDASGDPLKNAEIAKNRATGVKQLLLVAGIADDAVMMEKPQATPGGPDGTQARRVEVSLR